ncbi:MAG: uncharacterized protein KVP18_003063 [Porospora cf. gigantea A]|nr:MAG: hypothetical protein KVP18_003063 [Porospora cf. gigantea A]
MPSVADSLAAKYDRKVVDELARNLESALPRKGRQISTNSALSASTLAEADEALEVFLQALLVTPNLTRETVKFLSRLPRSQLQNLSKFSTILLPHIFTIGNDRLSDILEDTAFLESLEDLGTVNARMTHYILGATDRKLHVLYTVPFPIVFYLLSTDPAFLERILGDRKLMAVLRQVDIKRSCAIVKLPREILPKIFTDAVLLQNLLHLHTSILKRLSFFHGDVLAILLTNGRLNIFLEPFFARSKGSDRGCDKDLVGLLEAVRFMTREEQLRLISFRCQEDVLAFLREISQRVNLEQAEAHHGRPGNRGTGKSQQSKSSVHYIAGASTLGSTPTGSGKRVGPKERSIGETRLGYGKTPLERESYLRREENLLERETRLGRNETALEREEQRLRTARLGREETTLEREERLREARLGRGETPTEREYRLHREESQLVRETRLGRNETPLERDERLREARLAREARLDREGTLLEREEHLREGRLGHGETPREREYRLQREESQMERETRLGRNETPLEREERLRAARLGREETPLEREERLREARLGRGETSREREYRLHREENQLERETRLGRKETALEREERLREARLGRKETPLEREERLREARLGRDETPREREYRLHREENQLERETRLGRNETPLEREERLREARRDVYETRGETPLEREHRFRREERDESSSSSSKKEVVSSSSGIKRDDSTTLSYMHSRRRYPTTANSDRAKAERQGEKSYQKRSLGSERSTRATDLVVSQKTDHDASRNSASRRKFVERVDNQINADSPPRDVSFGRSLDGSKKQSARHIVSHAAHHGGGDHHSRSSSASAVVTKTRNVSGSSSRKHPMKKSQKQTGNLSTSSSSSSSTSTHGNFPHGETHGPTPIRGVDTHTGTLHDTFTAETFHTETAPSSSSSLVSRRPSFIDGMRVRYVEVPVVEYVEKHVSKKEVVFTEKHVPKKVYEDVEKIVEVPEVREVVREVEVPIHLLKPKEEPVVIAQSIQPIVTASKKTKEVQCSTFDPVVVPVDIYIPLPVHTLDEGEAVVKVHHERVPKEEVPKKQWNSLVFAVNRGQETDFLQDILIREADGSVQTLPPVEKCDVIPPVESWRPL